MKKLLIMRHADADFKSSGERDFDRPLNVAGKAAVVRMATQLGMQAVMPGLILSSPARRTRMTAESLLETLADKNIELRFCDSFYLASATSFLEELAELQCEEGLESGATLACVMVVGHNPGVSELVHVLTGTYCEMPPAAIATVELALQSWGEIAKFSAGTGQLVNQCHPTSYSQASD